MKVFLGYAPGVGKTMAMLEDADRRRQAAQEVLVGMFDVSREIPQGLRTREQALLQNFVSLPDHAALPGAPLEAILARSPQVEGQAQKFFQPISLFALRELAFRYVARCSNSLMRSYLAGRGLADTGPVSPRLLVWYYLQAFQQPPGARRAAYGR